MNAHYAAAAAHSAAGNHAFAADHSEQALTHRREAEAAQAVQTGKKGGKFVVTAGGGKRYVK